MSPQIRYTTTIMNKKLFSNYYRVTITWDRLTMKLSKGFVGFTMSGTPSETTVCPNKDYIV